MTSPPRLSGLDLRALREQFDNAFALPHAPPAPGRINLLAVRVGGMPYALRLQDMRGLHANLRILALPSGAPEFMGVTSIRGQTVPVYDLAALLGMDPCPAPRWMVLVQAGAPLALAFDVFDAHLCVNLEQVTAATGDGAANDGSGQAVQTAGGALPLLPLRALADRIARQYGKRPGGPR